MPLPHTMPTPHRLLSFALFAVFLIGLPTHSARAADDAALRDEALGYFEPLPDKPVFKNENPANKDKLELGKMLYFETRLSKSNVFSCASCHNLSTGGVDNNPFSTGHKWMVGGRNAPTVLNASLHIAQFWDGRAADVEAQAQGPILADVEMGATQKLVLKRLGSIPEYVHRFGKAFPNEKEPLRYENIANAIGAFERTLLTPSRFDSFLKGDSKALTDKEKEGLRVFMNINCAGCHNGPAVGGNGYQKFGVVKKPKNMEDLGRFGVTKAEEDKNVFKIPSLRNIELTYPYFHDGRHWKLEDAVKDMALYQLGEPVSKDDVEAIVAFLKSLTGKAPDIILPILPPSTDSTPIPDRN